MKRWILLFGVNIAIMVTISLIMSLLGFGHYMTANGMNYSALMVFCLLWGFGGAFISLRMSKWMAKKFMGVQVQSPTGKYGELVRMVHSLARKAGLSEMPEVGVYDSPEMNAFATGPSKNNSLVAVSTGLMSKMNRDELEGVLGHEVAHIANGDMVTSTLIQGVLNAFVMFFARIAAFAVSQALSDDEEGGGLGYFAHIMVIMFFEVVFGILASIIINSFSRFREFKADQGGASLAGREKMIMALQALQRSYEPVGKPEKSFQALQIASKGSFAALFSTHPPLEKRINMLKSGQ